MREETKSREKEREIQRERESEREKAKERDRKIKRAWKNESQRTEKGNTTNEQKRDR